jgi:hypothetical protein
MIISSYFLELIIDQQELWTLNRKMLQNILRIHNRLQIGPIVLNFGRQLNELKGENEPVLKFSKLLFKNFGIDRSLNWQNFEQMTIQKAFNTL